MAAPDGGRPHAQGLERRHPSVLTATLISMGVGALLLVPSLWWLYRIFQRTPAPGDAATR